jgi:DNA-directed RNA polymerase specialized sigma24 family protein
MSPLGPTAEWSPEARALRRFGMALARDNQWDDDEDSTAALVDSLVDRTLAARPEQAPRGLSRRSWLLSLFVRLYRRHVRLRLALEDGDEPIGARLIGESAARPDSAVERAMRAMSFELREALLLVALERLSHVEAAAALEISLSALLQRLARARAVLAQQMTPRPREAFRARSRAPHLRVIE